MARGKGMLVGVGTEEGSGEKERGEERSEEEGRVVSSEGRSGWEVSSMESHWRSLGLEGHPDEGMA